MRHLILFLALISAWAPSHAVDFHDHQEGLQSAAKCNCPPDCHCHEPGGTCPGEECSEDCECANPKKTGFWIHPEMEKAIEQNELKHAPVGVGMGAGPEGEETIVIDGKARFTGFRPLRGQYEGAKFKTFPIWKGAHAGEEVPEELNYLLEAPPNVVQQQCGDCWAQGAAMAFEGVIGWLDKVSRNISRQAIIDCSGYGSCGGGQISVGFFDSPEKGAVYTSDYGYVGRTQRCKKDSLVRREQARDTGFVRGEDGGRFTIQDLMRASFEHGPLEVCGAASALGGADKDGFILRNKRGGTNHCWAHYGHVRGEKYGKPPGIYGIEVNSWGKGFGKGGVVFVRLGQDDIHLDGSLITEAAFIDYKDRRPPEPIVFDLDLKDVELHVTITPAAIGWNQTSLTEALKAAYAVLEE